MLPNSTVCALPWVSIEVTPEGNYRPCCLAHDKLTHQGKTLEAGDTISQAYASDSLILLRQQFLNGEKPNTCNRCWSEEAVGKTSKRQRHLKKFEQQQQLQTIDWNAHAQGQLWFLDLKLGNICNLKCRICGPWSSSRWAQEIMDQDQNPSKKQTVAYAEQKQKEWPRHTPDFWTNLETLLPGVTEFEFTGGEPFLINEHFDILQTAVDLGVAHKISLHYNTNGTTWPEQAEIWKHFRYVEIAFSIDNIAEKFEYERSGASWSKLLSTIQSAKNFSHKSLLLQACVTVSALNVLDLPDICDWLDTQSFHSVYFNLLHDPWHFNIGSMTDQAKSVAAQSLQPLLGHSKFGKDIQHILNFMQSGRSTNGKEFISTVQRVDIVRKEDITNTHSDIFKVMQHGS